MKDYITSDDRINGYKRKWFETKAFESFEWFVFFVIVLTGVLFVI